MNDIALAIRLTADAEDASRAVEGVGDSFKSMASDVDAATAKTDAATSRMDGVADSADNVASRSAQAAGGIGDLAGALEATGVISEGTAAALETGAASIMGVTGAADLLNLVTTSNIVVQTKQRVATIANAVATRTAAAATRTMAVAQRILNAAMRANPIGIFITALVVVGGLLVLAYKRSETFRRIVNAVFRAVVAYVQGFIRVLTTVGTFLRDRVPAAAGALRDRVVAVWNAVRDAAARAWDAVRDKVSSVVSRIRELVSTISDKVADAGRAIRSALGDAFDWVLGKIQPVIDLIERIIDRIGDIKLPSLPNPFGRVAATPLAGGTYGPPTVTPVGRGGDVTNIYVSGALDPDAVARQLARMLNQRATRTGTAQIVGI